MKEFFTVFWDKKRASERMAQLLPTSVLGKGESRHSCPPGPGHRGGWWRRPVWFSLSCYYPNGAKWLVAWKALWSCSAQVNQDLCLIHAECDKTTGKKPWYQGKYPVMQRAMVWVRKPCFNLSCRFRETTSSLEDPMFSSFKKGNRTNKQLWRSSPSLNAMKKMMVMAHSH